MRLPWRRGRREAPEAPRPTPEGQRGPGPPRAEPQVRALWGKEFSLREQGLDEAQVTAFVNDLLSRYNALLQQYEQGNSLRGFSRQVMEDAERQAASLRARAKRDAEVEAARVLSEAQRQASQTVAQARQRAEEITGREAQDLIQAAQRRAELVERQSQIVAQQFLLQVREEVQSQITSEVQSAYYRLINTLQELMTAGQNVEAEWKSKTYQLLSSAPLELEQYQSRFMNSLLAGDLTAEAERPLGEEAEEPAAPVEPPKAGLGEVIVPEAPPPPPAEERERREAPLPQPPDAPRTPPATAPSVAQTVPPREERAAPTPPTIALEAPELLLGARYEEASDSQTPFEPEVVPPSPVREAVEDLFRGRPHPDALGRASPRPDLPDMEEPTGTSEKAAPADIVIPAAEPSAGRNTPARGPSAPLMTRDQLFQGEVDLVMGPSVDFQRVAKFYGHLQSLRGLQILRTTGDWSEGTVITVVLDAPTQLIVLLESVPDARVDLEAQEGRGRGDGAKGEKRSRITVALDGEP